jgi:hypothetical protein
LLTLPDLVTNVPKGPTTVNVDRVPAQGISPHPAGGSAAPDQTRPGMNR